MKKKETNLKNNKRMIADVEEARLKTSFLLAGANSIRLDLDSTLIRKVAEMYSELQVLEGIPSVAVNPNNLAMSKETAAGKIRVKLFATYSNAMIKLNRDLLAKGETEEAGGGLEDFE